MHRGPPNGRGGRQRLALCRRRRPLGHARRSVRGRSPRRPPDRCAGVVRAWCAARRRLPGQQAAYEAWAARWQEDHRRRLRAGLERGACRTWPELCRFAERWRTASRRTMPPFSGVASTLLATHRGSARRSDHYRSGVMLQISPEPHSLPRHELRASPAVLVVSSVRSRQAFAEFEPSRQLAWALNKSGFEWRLWHPWQRKEALDLEHLRGVVFWSYRHRRDGTYITRSSWSSSSSIVESPS